MAIHTNVHILNDQKLMSALRYLPNAWVTDEGATYSVINAPLGDIDSEPPVVNTVVIASEFCNPNRSLKVEVRKDLVFADTYVSFVRQTKFVQAALINKIAKDLGLTKFRPIQTYHLNQYDVLRKACTYILKPLNGARGIGQLKFEGANATMDGINRALQLIRNFQQSTSSVVIEIKDVTAFAEKEFSRLFKTEVKFPVNREHNPDEGINELLSGGIVTEYISEITKEYRLIIDHSSTGIAYGLERNRVDHNDNGFKQACGTEEHMNDCCSHVSELEVSIDVKRELQLLLKELNIPLHAIDFFYTCTPDRESWGILEISPDFGGVTVPGWLIAPEAKLFVQQV